MRKYVKRLLFISSITLIFIEASNGQGINLDSLRTDSLFKSINRKPSETELKWVIAQLHDPTSKESSRDLLPWITALTAIIGFFLQRMWQLKKDRLERLYNSLQWFEGHTQKRSLGIAMIEANWHKEKSFHKTWVSILTNQAVYLLRQSEQGHSAHEIENLKRIMRLLVSFKGECTEDELKQLSLALNDSFSRDGVPKQILKSEKDTNGLDLSDKTDFSELEKWKNIFPTTLK